jgi:hypothetical protein
VTPDSLHDLFFAAAGVAGALVGLLFVAISVEHDRITARDADQVSRVRARSALTAFTNALAVSLWALIPGNGLAISAVAAGTGGVLFVIASVLSVRRMAQVRGHQPERIRDVAFLITQLIVFALQILNGVRLLVHPHGLDPAEDIADLVVVCFLIGIYRSWELIGGPDIGLGHELRGLIRHQDEDAGAGHPPPAIADD